MFINSSLSLSVPHTQPSSNSSTYYICLLSTNGSNVIFAYAATNVLLLPTLCTLVLYVGFQRWKRQLSTSMVTATSNAELITYHMVGLEIFCLLGSGCYCIGNYVRNQKVMVLGLYFFSVVLPGETLFHCLTCIEQYLAVVHPITYLGLRTTGGIRIRNISIGCVWLVTFAWVGVVHLYLPDLPTLPSSLLFNFSLFAISFCGLSVLYALTRPGPGAGSGDRVDQSKQRAFHTIMAIMATLFLRFAGIIICLVIFKFNLLGGEDMCVVIKSVFWFCLPSSLVLPLLFLHRAGKLACFKHSTESR